jgi:hypothetical protein
MGRHRSELSNGSFDAYNKVHQAHPVVSASTYANVDNMSSAQLRGRASIAPRARTVQSVNRQPHPLD